jgi:hypothetical protein
MNAIPIQRGCGTRQAGGLYAETALSAHGSPVEDFIIDTPELIDTRRLGLTPVGSKLIERHGTFHLFDIVGSQHYPNVADYIEEVRVAGLSRRISSSLDLSKLTPGSQIILLHARAYVTNFAEYAARWVYDEEPTPDHPAPRCPKHRIDHDRAEAPAMCAGVWWQDVELGIPVAGTDPVKRSIRRQMPSFSYIAHSRPEGVEPQYQIAAFASFPIHRIVAIRGDRKQDDANKKRLSHTKLDTAFEDN